MTLKTQCQLIILILNLIKTREEHETKVKRNWNIYYHWRSSLESTQILFSIDRRWPAFQAIQEGKFIFLHFLVCLHEMTQILNMSRWLHFNSCGNVDISSSSSVSDMERFPKTIRSVRRWTGGENVLHSYMGCKSLSKYWRRYVPGIHSNSCLKSLLIAILA